MERFVSDILAIFQQPYILLIFLTALVFDFINGFHDAANSIATIVGTRVLRPLHAVVWAAWWNFAAAWVFGVAIANTVAKWVKPEFVNADVIFAGLLGAIVWDLITWRVGLPTSSSHALLGGFAGAALAYAAKWLGVVHTASVVKTVGFIFLAPLMGFVLGVLMIVGIMWLMELFQVKPSPAHKYFRVVQLFSAAAYSLGHGTNDAQKTMGIIAALLYASVWKHEQGAFVAGDVTFPFWIVLLCHAAIALGTVSGGWRIVKTMAMKITRLRTHQGASAETAAAISLLIAAQLGVPVSTTHTITGAIVGVGAIQRLSAVRWGMTKKVFWAWVLTIPASALIAFGALHLISLVKG